MNLPSQSSINAFGRHVLTSASTAVTVLAVTHLVSSDQASTLTTSVSQISQGVALIAAGLAPIFALVSALYSAYTASHPQQIAAVNAIPGVKVVNESATTAPAVSAPPVTPK